MSLFDLDGLHGRLSHVGDAIREWVAMDEIRGRRFEAALDHIEFNTRDARDAEYEFITGRYTGVTDGATWGMVELPVVPLGHVMELRNATVLDINVASTGLQLFGWITDSSPGALAPGVAPSGGVPIGYAAVVSNHLNFASPIIVTEQRKLVFRVSGPANTNFALGVQYRVIPTRAKKLSRSLADSEVPNVPTTEPPSDSLMTFGDDKQVPDDKQTVKPAVSADDGLNPDMDLQLPSGLNGAPVK